MMNFEGHAHMKRIGSEKDVEALKVLFEKLDYEVQSFIDLKAQVAKKWRE